MAYMNVGHSFSHLVMLLFPTIVLTLEQVWATPFVDLLPLGFAGYLLFGLGALPAGWLGDRWDSGKMMVLFFIGTAAACLLAGFAKGPISLALALTMIGLLASIYHPVALAWIVGTGDRPGRALGMNGVFGAAGTASAALLAGILSDLISWRAAFIIPGLACLIIGLLFWRELWLGRCVMQRTPYRPDRTTPDRAGVRRGLALMLGAILFTGMIFQMNAVGLPKIFQTRLGDEIGFNATAAGSLVSIVYVISMLGQLLGGYLADRFDERKLYIASYIVQIGLLAVIVFTQNIALIVLVALAVTVQTGTQPVENCLVAHYTPTRWRATLYGLKFVVALGISALGVPLIAMIYATTGSFDGVFWTMAIFSVIIVLIASALPASRNVQQKATPATSS